MEEAGGGFDDDQFVDDVPVALKCPICLLVLRDPHLLSCCGAHICEACIHRLNADLCPCCRGDDYKTLLNKQLRGVVLSLKVKCRNNHCLWKGELGDLKRHLDTNCEYEEEACRYECGIRLTRKELMLHEREACPRMPVSVAISTFKELMEAKIAELATVHRREMDEVKKLLEDQQHLVKDCLEKEKDYLSEIAKLQEQIALQKEQFVKKMVKQEERYCNELSVLKEQVHSQGTATSSGGLEVNQPPGMFVLPAWWPHPLPISGQVYPPCLLAMPDYSLQTKDTDEWFSPPFYSGPGGYKFCLRVRGIGQGKGLNTHVSVFVHLMKSNNDDKLKWPLSAEVSLQMVNVREDNGHVELKVPFNDKMQPEARARVRDKERAAKGIGFHEFVKRENLEYNVVKDTQFLQSDCLLFRVLSVSVLK